MSYENTVPTDCIYSYHNASTNLATFTTEDNLMKTYPPAILRAGTWLNAQATGKNLRVRASGQLGSTGTPTFTWTVRLITGTTVWSAGGVPLGSTAALTTQTTVTLAYWFMDLQIGLRTLGIGGASTVVTTGTIYSPFGLATATNGGGTIPASNVAPTTATVDNSVQYLLWISAACGTSNAANLINMQSLVVTADN